MSKKILIAEDEKAMARAVELKLKHEGFETKIANNGEEALNYLAKEKFDLLLLDLMMPKVDGFAVLLKLQEEKNKMPVVVTSNLSQAEDIAKTKELGAVDFLVKSNVSLSQIIETIKKILKI